MYKSSPESLDAFRAAIRRGLSMYTPPPVLTISEWADRYGRLPRESSPEPGQWMTSRAEYQREPMDIITDPNIETAVLKWASQTGKSAILLHVMAYYAHQDPSPILMMQPSLEMAQTFSKDRIATMIRDTPVLTPLFGDPRSRDSGNTLLHKMFPGGHITLAGSNSPGSLAMRPIRILFADEVDRYNASAGTEGDPIELANARSSNFWNRKKIYTSTPKAKGTSRIDKAFNESDQRYYHVPCPQCEQMQTLKWSNLKWPSPRTSNVDRHQPENCYYVCENGCEIQETDKPAMIAAGRWIAEKPGNGDGKTAGFALNQLYSPWRTWPEIIHNFLRAKKGGPSMLQPFVNTVLGEAWESDGDSIDDLALESRKEIYEAALPAGVLVVTAGVDVQSDRLEVEVDGWGMAEESWAIEHRVFRGNPAMPDIWDELDKFLAKTYDHENGIRLRIACTLIDSGGHHTKQVYAFAKPRKFRRIYACKGIGGAGKPLAGRPTKGNRIGADLFPVGVDTAKELLYARMRIDAFGPGYCHYPSGHRDESGDVVPCTAFDEEYFAQLKAEKLETRTTGNVSVKVWTKIRARNEALDLRVYSLAALDVLKPNFPAIAATVEAQAGIAKERKREAIEEVQDSEAEPAIKPPPRPAPKPKSYSPPRPRWIDSWRS